MENLQTEIWMLGPIGGITTLLQPVAHALLQVNNDVQSLITANLFPYLWLKPHGMASIAFHLQHIPGVIDRMLTYASGNALNQEQFDYLKKEGIENSALKIDILKDNLKLVTQKAINQLKLTQEITLSQTRFLGRKQIPTTQIGLLFHAAEHAQRHYGQLLVTVNLLKAKQNNI